jgi:hypothetical protein
MLIEKKSMFTGLYHTRDINVTREELLLWEQSGRTVQSVFPDLSADDREFLMTGVTPEEWDAYMGREEDLECFMDPDAKGEHVREPDFDQEDFQDFLDEYLHEED